MQYEDVGGCTKYTVYSSWQPWSRIDNQLWLLCVHVGSTLKAFLQRGVTVNGTVVKFTTDKGLIVSSVGAGLSNLPQA